MINSLRGGAAGGGTRMRKGLDQNEVMSLAKTMEVKIYRFGDLQLAVQNRALISIQMIQEKEVFWSVGTKPLPHF